MRLFYKALFASIIFFLLVIFAYFSIWEVWQYQTRNEVRDTLAASAMFRQVCQKEGFDEENFVGPVLEVNGNVSRFIWSLKAHPDETIDVFVSYLPFDVSYNVDPSLMSSPATRKQKSSPFLHFSP